MRMLLLSWVILLLGGAPSFAGLYNTSEPGEEKKSDPGIDSGDWFRFVFRTTLLQLRTIGMATPPLDNPLRKRYVLEAELAARLRPDTLTSEQKLNLSAVLIRRRKYDEAIDLLKPLERTEPKNFLTQSNLATAYQLAGQESRAIATLEQTLSIWPPQMSKVEEPLHAFLQSIGWHEGAFDFYRNAEKHQLKLLKLRAREGTSRPGSKADFDAVDALFDDGKSPSHPVKFVGPSGKYEPGALALVEKAKLPKDAIDIVQQLLIWLPEDTRLYWLLGELYNAQGGAKNIQSARMIFEELAGFNGLGVRAPLLAEHRKDLLNFKSPDLQQPTTYDLDRKLDQEEKKGQEQAPRIDWQPLGIGFGAGVLVALFGMLQIREIARRRRRQN
jgi:hypothetical protein